MLAFSVITFLTAALLTGFGIAIYKGKTDLIHAHHQTQVTDRESYGKAFAKALFVIASTLLFSGIIGLFGDSDRHVIFAVATLIAGICIGTGCIVAVQKKYNKGVI